MCAFSFLEVSSRMKAIKKTILLASGGGRGPKVVVYGQFRRSREFLREARAHLSQPRSPPVPLTL